MSHQLKRIEKRVVNMNMLPDEKDMEACCQYEYLYVKSLKYYCIISVSI